MPHQIHEFFKDVDHPFFLLSQFSTKAKPVIFSYMVQNSQSRTMAPFEDSVNNLYVADISVKQSPGFIGALELVHLPYVTGEKSFKLILCG